MLAAAPGAGDGGLWSTRLLSAQFIGSPPMNVANGTLQERTFVIGDDRVTTEGAQTVNNAVIGLRTENILSIKAPKEFKGGFDTDIGIAFNTERLYLVDIDTGAHIRR